MITGGLKVFDESKCLQTNGATCVASTGTAVENNCLDKNRITYWTSVGSSNGVTETLTITFATVAISRLLLVDHNWKTFTAKWWNGSAFVDFTTVSGLDGSVSAINETNFADTTAYYEFNSVTTTQIQLTVTNVQASSAISDKYIASVIATNELGTLNGFPQLQPTFTRNEKVMQALSGKVKVVKQDPAMSSLVVSYKNYPVGSFGSDMDLLFTLYDREVPFLVWPCGGRRGTKYFSYGLRTWRLIDLFRMQASGDISPEFTEGMYSRGAAVDFTLVESV